MEKPKYIIGVDEVGRGPIAGPVTVCVVRVSREYFPTFNKVLKKKGIKDSKALSESKRRDFHSHFKKLNREDKSNFHYAVSSVSAKIIDKKGIRYALNLAMKRCLKKLGTLKRPADFQILLDGSLYAPDIFINQKTVTKGDTIHPIISTASIIAKETRDAKMHRYARREKYQEYGFDQHVGYGTKQHYQAIKRHGLTDLHRKSWVKKIRNY